MLVFVVDPSTTTKTVPRIAGVYTCVQVYVAPKAVGVRYVCATVLLPSISSQWLKTHAAWAATDLTSRVAIYGDGVGLGAGNGCVFGGGTVGNVLVCSLLQRCLQRFLQRLAATEYVHLAFATMGLEMSCTDRRSEHRMNGMFASRQKRYGMQYGPETLLLRQGLDHSVREAETFSTYRWM